MHLKILGAVLTVVGCGCVGISMGVQHMQAHRSMKQLIRALEAMICDLQYKLIPLPELCRSAARHSDGKLKYLFLALAAELEDSLTEDVYRSVCRAIKQTHGLHPTVQPYLKQLGKSFGHFELEGQLLHLEAVREECRNTLKELEDNKAYRIRSYQTLSLCAGAALAVLLL